MWTGQDAEFEVKKYRGEKSLKMVKKLGAKNMRGQKLRK